LKEKGGGTAGRRSEENEGSIPSVLHDVHAMSRTSTKIYFMILRGLSFQSVMYNIQAGIGI
jgi:hypothetical protein